MSDVIQFQPSRKVLYVRCLAAAIFFLVPGLIAWIVLSRLEEGLRNFASLALAALLLISALTILYIVFHFPTIRYEVTGNHVINSEGLFWKVKRYTPLDKITNVDVRQGPIDRWLGIGKVWIFTPSTGALTPEAMLAGIDRPHDVRALIVSRSAQSRSDQSPGEPGKASASEAILKDVLGTLKSIEKLLRDRGHE